MAWDLNYIIKRENYMIRVGLRDAPLLVERAVDQPSLLDTNIPIWFATKD